MRKTKFITIMCLAVIFITAITAVPSAAKSLDPEQIRSDLVTAPKMEVWIYTHLKEDIEISKGISEGDYSALEKYITDPVERDYFLRISNYSLMASDLIKTTSITANPMNSEHGRILAIVVKNSDPAIQQKSLSRATRNFGFLAASRNASEKVDIYPFFIYKDTANNLVVLSTMTNNTKGKVTIVGIPYIELVSNGKTIARGNASDFDNPISFSAHENKANIGVQGGLPTKCFLKMTFEPGTYDDSVDISNLDNLSCAFALDYQVIQ